VRRAGPFARGDGEQAYRVAQPFQFSLQLGGSRHGGAACRLQGPARGLFLLAGRRFFVALALGELLIIPFLLLTSLL
jgi:hypothetical protein